MSITLREFIVEHFDLEEFRTLCSDLGVEYDDLRGEGRTARVRELIKLLHRHGRLDKLVEAVQELRPKVFREVGFDLELEMISVPAGTDQPPPRVPRWRRDWLHVGLLGLVLVALVVLIVMVGPWGKGAQPATTTSPAVAQAHTATPSRTLTPSPTPLAPTATPSPSPAPTVMPADVLIAEFDAPSTTAETARIGYRLEADLQDRLRKAGLSNVTIGVISSPVTGEEQARALASEKSSKVVIWGWYDKNDVQVRIFLAGGGPWRDQPATHLVPLERSSESEELSIVVEDVVEEELADDVSFLSFFVIGHLHYLANEYQMGHAAFDAAMENIPVNAYLQNRALLPFFEARQLEAQDNDDIMSVVCKYAEAIELDPAFAEAYNNLGIIFARHSRTSLELPGWWLSDEARSCLARAGLEGASLTVPSIFDTALQLRPQWAIAEYNKLGFYWQHLDWLTAHEGQVIPGEKEWLKTRLTGVVERDASIPGAYVVLGTIALEERDFKAAIDWFLLALALIPAPESATVHFNLGYAYLHLGQEEQAAAAFEAALAADPSETEAHLALANLSYRLGQQERAVHHLNALLPSAAISATRLGAWSPGAMALILQSRIHYDADEVDLAIETLEQSVSLIDDPFLPDTEARSYIPLERYLLGLLYTLNGNPEMASTHWATIRILDSPSSLSSAEKVWYEIVGRCDKLKGFSGISDWDAAADPCLPTNLRERITTVYDLFQDQLSERYYFRSVYYGPLACPHIFTRDPQSHTWRWDTTILFNLVGRENETLQSRRLARFDGQLLVREMEPETSYIDQLYVVIVRDDGQEQILPASLAVLREADDRYLVLNPGDRLRLTFDGYRATTEPHQAWVVAKGYYVPLPGRTGD